MPYELTGPFFKPNLVLFVSLTCGVISGRQLQVVQVSGEQGQVQSEKVPEHGHIDG